MEQMTFRLDAFEGPLDLLLELIKRHKLNIYDIEISALLEQYLEYIDAIEESDLDSAGEFLTMAARLIYIKTCSLLPQAQEAGELKKELEGELIEYSLCREAAKRLRDICIYGEVFVRPPEKLPVNLVFTGSISPNELIESYMGMTAKARRLRPLRAEQFSPLVASRIVTVTSKIVFVLKKLYKCGECLFSELYEGIENDRSARIATFLAVLELTRSGRIMLNDDNSVISFNKNAPRRHSAQDRSAPPSEREEPTVTEEITAEQEEPAVTEEIAAEREEPAEPEEITSEREEPDENKKNGAAASVYAIAEKRGSAIKAMPAAAIFIEMESASSAPQPAQKPKKRSLKKQNRFSLRCHWGYPEKRGSCWKYRRERSLWI